MADTKQKVDIPVPIDEVQKKTNSAIKHFHGRAKIILPFSKEKFLDGTIENIVERIVQYLPYVTRIHRQNAEDIGYLFDYYRGIQPILNKEKTVRPDINHIVEENHAFEIVEFKKAYEFGEPVQYVQKGEKEIERIAPQISKLNAYMDLQNKSTADKQICEWDTIAGTAYRYIDASKGDDETPFIMSVPDPRQTFIVYSNSIREEVLFSGFINYEIDPLNVGPINYTTCPNEITIYTDDFIAKFKGTYTENIMSYEPIEQRIPLIDSEEEISLVYPLAIKGNRIIEYPLNNARIGLIEIVMSSLDAINQIKSNLTDDIDQFVQSLLVFVNQDVDAEELKKLVSAGAIKVVSSDPNKPADVKLLETTLNHTDVKSITDDLYQNILTICGIPRLNDAPSGGDTGQARLIGEGWTMADERAKQDELSFKKSEKKALKLAINISKENKNFEGNDENCIKDLEAKDIDIKFNRNKSDNLMVKTQGLINMKTAQVDPSVAFATSGLFSDPNEVFNKSKKHYGKNFWNDESKNKETNNTNIPNITDNINLPTNKDKENVAKN